MLLFRVELNPSPAVQFDDCTVHPCADKSFATQSLNDIAEFAFLVTHDGCKNHDSGARWQSLHFVHDVRGGLADDRHAGFRAIGLADVRVKQAQVIKNLGGGGDNRAWAGARTSLLDGDSRR